MEKIFLRIRGICGKEQVIFGIASLALLCVLCSTFTQFRINDPSFTVYHLSLTVLVAFSIICLFVFLTKRKVKMQFASIDGWLIFLFGYFLFRYDFDLQLANWKLLLGGEICILWFLIRLLSGNRLLPVGWLSWMFIITGCLQAVWGLLQLYGYCNSNHNGFSLTGSFLNPGPYSGFVAMMIPIALHQCLSGSSANRYVALAALALMLCILPAGMSRSAWGGAAISSFFVLFWQREWGQYWYSKRRLFIILILTGVISGILGGIFLFNLKKDSAYGRLFIWENIARATLKEPVVGYGSCMFPVVYAREQSDKFRSGTGTDIEERVAGNPEYAFNEYLQLLTEGGFILLFLFLGLVGYAFRQGLLQKNYGICGGLLSFLVFAFSSYPLQIPSFCVAVAMMSACLVANNRGGMSVRGSYALIVLLFCASVLIYCQKPAEELAVKWEKCRLLKLMDAAKAQEKGYISLYPYLKHNPDFIYEYAQCLTKQKKHLESNRHLRRYLLLQCNAQAYNSLGINYQELGLYTQAEKSYYSSVYLLPNRIYPYYLLAKLYALPNFNQLDKFNEMVAIVLNKIPKVHSKAIDEMRNQMIEIAGKHQSGLFEKNQKTDKR